MYLLTRANGNDHCTIEPSQWKMNIDWMKNLNWFNMRDSEEAVNWTPGSEPIKYFQQDLRLNWLCKKFWSSIPLIIFWRANSRVNLCWKYFIRSGPDLEDLGSNPESGSIKITQKFGATLRQVYFRLIFSFLTPNGLLISLMKFVIVKYKLTPGWFPLLDPKRTQYSHLESSLRGFGDNG